LRWLYPGNWRKKKRRLNLKRDRVKDDIAHEVQNLETESKRIEENLLIINEDLEIIEHGISGLYRLGNRLSSNLVHWRKQPIVGGDITIVNLYRAIIEMIELLEELAEDEKFAKATGLKIRKEESIELANLKAIYDMLPKELM